MRPVDRQLGGAQSPHRRMDATRETAPSGTPASSSPPAPAVLADGGPAALAPPADRYLDLALDDDEELRVAAEAAAESAAAAETLAPPTAAVRHAIPELPRLPPPSTPFLPQLAVLAGVALLVCVVAIAAAHPPAPPAAPARVAQTPPIVLRAPDGGFATIEPRRAAVEAVPVRRTAKMRPRPIHGVAAPSEIGPGPAPAARERPSAPPAPVAAPVLEGSDDQSIRDPPLTGT